jgi:hypothetical protein
MKKLLSISILFTALNYAWALPTFDPFADATATGGTSYAVGAGLAGNNTFVTNDWTLVNSNSANLQEPLIVATNLTYLDLPTSTGNAISNAGPPANLARTARLNMRINTTVGYYSFLLMVTDLTMVPSYNTNNFVAGFSDTVGGQAGNLARCGGRLVFKQSGGGYVVGVGKGTTQTDYVYDTTVRNLGEVVFVVVSYERAGGATNVNLWVNPPSSSFGTITPPAPTASVPPGSGAGDMNASPISAFVLSCQTVTMPSCIIDEVRVATNWAYVTAGNPTFPVAINVNPASRNVRTGDRVSFVVGNSGTLPTYQWRHNGTNITDATNVAYTILSAQSSDVGNYSVVVSNVINSLTSAPAALTVSSSLQLFETDLVVVRVGDGAQTLATSGNSVYLDQFTTNGTYVNTVFVADSGPSALIVPGPDVNGTTLTGTALTRSMDKRLMVLAGFNTNLSNATPLQNTTSVAVPRGIVTINSAAQLTLAVADTNAYSSGYFRAAVSDGTNNFWGSGNITGTYYFGFNAPPAFAQSLFINTRSVDIFNGNLYCLSSQSGASGLIHMVGLPTTDQGAVTNLLTGFSSANTTDFAISPNDSLVYVTVATTVQRWSFSGSSWINDYNLNLPATGRYLTVDFSGANPVIYATTSDGTLVKIEDTGASSPATTLATSGPNQLLKGIRFGPTLTTAVAPPVLHFERAGSDLLLNWSGAFFLQSATNVTGPYGDVSGASSPHTNSMVSPPTQQFFRLRN